MIKEKTEKEENNDKKRINVLDKGVNWHRIHKGMCCYGPYMLLW